MLRLAVPSLVLAACLAGAGGGLHNSVAGPPRRPAAVLASPPVSSVSYVAPVPTPLHVVRGFDAPASPYGPGHRGVDLAVAAGQVVRAAGPGVVSFAGPVAGRSLVVVAHPDGIRTEYEPLQPDVTTGTSVAAGTVLGRLAGRHAGCPARHCLHWGARRGATYLDPLQLLAPLQPVRLLPWHQV